MSTHQFWRDERESTHDDIVANGNITGKYIGELIDGPYTNEPIHWPGKRTWEAPYLEMSFVPETEGPAELVYYPANDEDRETMNDFLWGLYEQRLLVEWASIERPWERQGGLASGAGYHSVVDLMEMDILIAVSLAED